MHHQPHNQTAPSSATPDDFFQGEIDVAVPAAWRIGTTWRIRTEVTNSHGELDVAEYDLDDEQIADAVCRMFSTVRSKPDLEVL